MLYVAESDLDSDYLSFSRSRAPLYKEARRLTESTLSTKLLKHKYKQIAHQLSFKLLETLTLSAPPTGDRSELEYGGPESPE